MSFDFEFTKEHLAAMIPSNKSVDDWYEALAEIMPKYGITTERRVAHFVSQCAHESGDFRTLEENLNYSDKALLSVFGRYFGAPPKRDAAEYARNPEKIANYVYQDEFRSKAGQMGNVNEGDGWLFRGRGLKQLTGRNNYTNFGKSVDMTAEEAAEYVSTPKGAVESACWFWDTNKLNTIADTDDVVKMTKKINGGDIGLEDRQKRYANAIKILGGESIPAAATPAATKTSSTSTVRTLRKGDKGDDVARMQKALGITADGDFGFGTQTALKKWQKLNGLVADGIAGPATLGKLL
jgi:putative chitinase